MNKKLCKEMMRWSLEQLIRTEQISPGRAHRTFKEWMDKSKCKELDKKLSEYGLEDPVKCSKK